MEENEARQMCVCVAVRVAVCCSVCCSVDRGWLGVALVVAESKASRCRAPNAPQTLLFRSMEKDVTKTSMDVFAILLC